MNRALGTCGTVFNSLIYMQFESKEERKQNTAEKISKDITAKKFPKFGKAYTFEFEKAQRTPSSININIPLLSIIIKLLKIKRNRNL